MRAVLARFFALKHSIKLSKLSCPACTSNTSNKSSTQCKLFFKFNNRKSKGESSPSIPRHSKTFWHYELLQASNLATISCLALWTRMWATLELNCHYTWYETQAVSWGGNVVPWSVCLQVSSKNIASMLWGFIAWLRCAGSEWADTIACFSFSISCKHLLIKLCQTTIMLEGNGASRGRDWCSKLKFAQGHCCKVDQDSESKSWASELKIGTATPHNFARSKS